MTTTRELALKNWLDQSEKVNKLMIGYIKFYDSSNDDTEVEAEQSILELILTEKEKLNDTFQSFIEVIRDEENLN